MREEGNVNSYDILISQCTFTAGFAYLIENCVQFHCYSQRCCFSRPIVPQEGCDLPFVEADAEAVHSRARPSFKHLD